MTKQPGLSMTNSQGTEKTFDAALLKIFTVENLKTREENF